MVFASHIFLVFLSLVLAAFYIASRVNAQAGKWVLIAASLFFYGYWLPAYLLLLLASICANYGLGQWLRRHAGQTQRFWVTAVGIAGNLSVIAFYKYAAFLVESWNWSTGSGLNVPQIILPIGISFFTFQQVSYLVEMYRRRVEHDSFVDYVLYICFFPQLIAGPIVTQSEMLPQLAQRKQWRLQAWQVALGFAIFSIGLFKKTVLMDPYVPNIDRVYALAGQGVPIGFVDGWTAALGYSFQIYFDFSAYSDMAIGLAFMFGLKLPVNFFSPYKARSMRDFWRRWHITLSRFLRDYIYIPLGGSRNGTAVTVFALVVTMGLGGLWHGASWTFVIWGLAHGILLVINHVWRQRQPRLVGRFIGHPLIAVPVTFLIVTVLWVFFRAPDFATAFAVLKAMCGLGAEQSFTRPSRGIVPLFPLYFIIVWLLPNTLQIMRRYDVALHMRDYVSKDEKHMLDWTFLYRLGDRRWALVSVITFAIAWFSISDLSPFIYFQF